MSIANIPLLILISYWITPLTHFFPLYCLQFLSLHLILPAGTFQFFTHILDSTLHFPSLSPLFLPRPHYLFLLFSHTSQPPPSFAVSQYSMATASCCCTDLSSFYVTALFPSLPFGHVVSCLQPLQSAIDNGRPLLIK